MSVTITRTAWIDDDGTGTTGTVLNNAVKTSIYNEIDAALAKVAQLDGGNTFTGPQSVVGLVSVSGFGIHGFVTGGVGANEVRVGNSLAGVANSAAISVGNDTVANQIQLLACSSLYTPNVYLQPNASVVLASGTGGLSMATNTPAPIRFWTNFGERLRITPTGEVFVNTATNAGNAQLIVQSDQTHTGLVIQNNNPANALTMLAFMNSAAGVSGTITQTGAGTVAYNTASDGRLKTDDGPAADLAALRAVVVHDFTWKADGVHDRGIFAQEAHALYPRAVSPGTDETTETGELARPWMTDYSKFVPDLIVGWQQHDAAIAELRALLETVRG